MASSAPHPAVFAVRSGRLARPRYEAVDRLYLRPSGDGWSLVNSAGEVLLRGLGLGSRRQCLQLARDMGALVVYA